MTESGTTTVLPLVVLAPFLAALAVPALQAAGVRSRRLPGVLMLALSAASFGWLLAQWPGLVDGEPVEWSRRWVGDLGWSVALRLDGLSHLFAMLITGVGALIAWYALGYLGDNERNARFFFSLLAFQGGMLLAVTADDLVLLYIGWEATSIASFALIGYSHESAEARRSAQHALLVTAAGGLAMLGGLVLLTVTVGATRISELTAEGVLSADPVLAGSALVLIALGALTKSAQFPFHGWLPGAMAAPTPVSAYLHSATMVKLGVYLVARLQPALGGLALWGLIFPIAGGVTMVLGAVLAVRERDLKRVLAYSTVSALGSMVMLAGIGTGAAMKALVVTVLAHACYKAALFMVAGTIDHETGTRDRLALGGLRRSMPLLAGAGIVAAISMAGLPPAFGFLSKETMLVAGFDEPRGWLVVGAVGVMGVLSIVVGWAAGVAPFLGATTETPKHPHEGPPSLWGPPVLLAVAGVAIGLAGPGIVGPALEPAVAAAAGREYAVHLAFWEGWNRVIVASIVVILGGAALTVAHRRYPSLPWVPVRSDVVMDAFMAGLTATATRVTHLTQHGNIPLYVATALALGSVPIAVLGIAAAPLEGLEPAWDPLVLTAALVVVVGALAAANSRTRFRSIAALGAVGFGITLLFFMFGAPDLAMTQVLVETLTVILFIFAFRFLPVAPPRVPRATQATAVVIAVITGIGMTALTLAAVTSGHDNHLRGFFEEASVPVAHGRNVVNTILVDFRAMDTLGEITVLAAAAIGILALLRLTARGDGPPMNEVVMSGVLRSAVRGLLPLLVVLAFFLFLRGHNDPGGGFIAGLVAAAAVALYALAFDVAAARDALRMHPQAFIGAGLAVALLAAGLGAIDGSVPLTGQWIEVTVPYTGAIKVGTPLLFDLGVFLVVVGVASTLATALLEER